MSAPVVTGAPDARYLREALARAGRPADVELLASERLTEGRVNAGISRLRTSNGSYVWKPIPRRSWSAVSLGPGHGEAELWLAGATRDLPAPLHCPTIDVADHVEEDEWWMLMDDVSSGIWPPSHFDTDGIRRLLGGLARLHARWWEKDADLARLPLPSLDASTGSIGRATLHAMRGGATEGWVIEAVERTWVVRELAPIFLQTLDPADADFFLELCGNRAPWVAALERLPPTLIHTDLRRANLSFEGDRISVFDWERATRGPAGLDLHWFWFLRFWAYPPAGGHPLSHWDPLVDEYLERLEEALGHGVDRAAFRAGWDVGWIAVLTQIAWCLSDKLASPDHTAEDRVRVQARLREAMAQARRAFDAHVR